MRCWFLQMCQLMETQARLELESQFIWKDTIRHQFFLKKLYHKAATITLVGIEVGLGFISACQTVKEKDKHLSISRSLINIKKSVNQLAPTQKYSSKEVIWLMTALGATWHWLNSSNWLWLLHEKTLAILLSFVQI